MGGGVTFWVLQLVIVLFSSGSVQRLFQQAPLAGVQSGGVWLDEWGGAGLCQCRGWLWCRCREVGGGPSEERRPRVLFCFVLFCSDDLHGILAGLHLQQRPCSCCLCFARGEVATFSP